MDRATAAAALEKLGWSLIRYSQRIRREIAKPSPEHCAASRTAYEKAVAQMKAFSFARKQWRGK